MDYPVKRSVLDVLLFLIEYCEETELELAGDRDALTAELRSAGFAAPEVERAFAWLESLALPAGSDGNAACGRGPLSGIRTWSREEELKLSRASRGLVSYLEQAGLFDRISLEKVIDRALALESDQIDLEQMKWVLLMVLFNQEGQEQLFASMESLLRADSSGDLH